MRLLALLLLLPVFAHAVDATQCWDGSYSTGACPVQPLSITPDLAPTETTATIVVNLSAAADTLYTMVKAASGGVCPTSPTVAQIVGNTGSGIIDHVTTNSPTSGNNNVAIDGMSANSEYCAYSVAVKNGNPSTQSAASSNAFIASIPFFTAAVPGDLVKWNPGHYIQLNRNSNTIMSLTQATAAAAKEDVFDVFAANTDVEGFVVPYRWRQLENSQGDYSAMITAIAADLAYVKALAVPKRLWVRLIDFNFGGTNPATDTYFPPYIRTAGYTYQGTNGVGWCRWSTAANDRYIALIEAIAAEFDDDPYFEAIYLYREVAPALVGTPCAYTKAKYLTESLRLAQAATDAFVTTNVVMPANFGPSDVDGNANLVAGLSSRRTGIGSPDILPFDGPVCANYEQWGDAAFRGQSPAPGNVDLRGEIASIWSMETTNINGSLGACTYQQIYTYAYDTLEASHIGWSYNTDGTWTAITNLLATGLPVRQSCPTSYPGCLTGGE